MIPTDKYNWRRSTEAWCNGGKRRTNLLPFQAVGLQLAKSFAPFFLYFEKFIFFHLHVMDRAHADCFGMSYGSRIFARQKTTRITIKLLTKKSIYHAHAAARHTMMLHQRQYVRSIVKIAASIILMACLTFKLCNVILFCDFLFQNKSTLHRL